MFKTMEEATSYIFNKKSNMFTKNLEKFKELLNELSIDTNQNNIIHIVGTNGKGSVVKYLSELLINNGYNVGCFTSPHVKDVNERITYNNSNISDNDFLNILNKIESHIQKTDISISFFEYLVIISLIYFKNLEVDYLIYEAGIGGLYDSTNIFTKKQLNILTSVSIDHTDVLGNSEREIAIQKLGVVNPHEILIHNEESIMTLCKEMFITNICVSKQSYEGRPKYDSSNLSLAVEAYKLITNKSVTNVDLENLKRPKYRLEEYQKDVFIDVGHNIEGIKQVSKYLLEKDYSKFTVIYSGLQNKEYDKIINYLSEQFDEVYITKNSNQNSITKENTISHQSKHNVTYIENTDDIIKNKSNKEMILITGSFYFISDIIK